MSAWEVRGDTPAWTRLPRPEPQSHETLVAVAFSGVCGSDLAKLVTLPSSAPGHSWIPGHEIVGRDLGTPGAPLVVIDPLVCCGTCAYCGTGDIHLCRSVIRLGWDLPGGFAEYVVAPRRNVLLLPDGVVPIQGVLADALAVAIHGVRCGLPHRPPRSRLAVIGSGPLALCTAAYAAAVGWSVTVVIRNAGRIRSVAAHIDATFATLSDITHGEFDAVVDAASGQDSSALDTALALVRDGGTVLVQNAYAPGVRLGQDLRGIFRRSITMTGSFSYCRRNGDGDLREALEILRLRPTWAQWLVSARFPLRSLPAALSSVTGGEAERPLKAVLTTDEVSPHQ
ncbi:alcohol dehydrogenase catalytic domain-containing protein [Streptomyces avidinii]|uniref:alcohol dehydrogenase catalytic domain-containing protein n=1 Tax=Streptomyces avidinii TaxID=1895 RepID=UPI003789DED0